METNTRETEQTIMSKYHPDIRFLTDYAAGSLPASQALCVAAHLHFCPDCRRGLQEITELGAVLFSEAGLAPASNDEAGTDFEKLMARIEELGPEAETATVQAELAAADNNSGLPPVLDKLTRGDLDALPWIPLGSKFKYTELATGDRKRETSLFNIKAGGSVPHHSHRGDEITVVLKGSFSDQDDHYQAGDFIVRTRGEAHRPVAAQDEDCLCLSTLDAPIRLSNWLYRLLLPLIRKPA